MKLAMRKLCRLSGLFLLLCQPLAAAHVEIDRWALLESRGPDKRPYLKPIIGKASVQQLWTANHEQGSTTSCRLENKRLVLDQNLQISLQKLEWDGVVLENRETKNLPEGNKSGTFTFYGSPLKFKEAFNLPRTSIKMRLRFYITNAEGHTRRAEGFEDRGFLEIKIKNPFPEYPLSVHKYRLLLPDGDLLDLINADPLQQNQFLNTIENLKDRAHERDREKKQTALINAMFEQITLLAIAEPQFIQPGIGISYYRKAKQYKDVYKYGKETKIRYFEITIDEEIKAFRAEFVDSAIDIRKYFIEGGSEKYLIVAYPPDVRAVELKQPDSIGYDGPGVIKKHNQMSFIQEKLWRAFIGDLSKNKLLMAREDMGKFAQIRSFLKTNNQEERKELPIKLSAGFP